jgi:hypothetical protein
LNLNLGASYKLVPDRFTVNAGISATPLSYSSSAYKYKPTHVGSVSTTKTTDAAGNVTENKTVNPAAGGNRSNLDYDNDFVTFGEYGINGLRTIIDGTCFWKAYGAIAGSGGNLQL